MSKSKSRESDMTCPIEKQEVVDEIELAAHSAYAKTRKQDVLMEALRIVQGVHEIAFGFPAPKWEVQTGTLCDGWINVWTWEEGEEGPKRQLFDSESDAKAAIYDFLIDVAASPDIAPYNVEDYRVVEVET